jgi:hypothetical protein
MSTTWPVFTAPCLVETRGALDHASSRHFSRTGWHLPTPAAQASRMIVPRLHLRNCSHGQGAIMTNPTLPPVKSDEAFDPSAHTPTLSADNTWYQLKVTYRDNNGVTQTSYASENTSDYYNHYLIMQAKPLRFRVAQTVTTNGTVWTLWEAGNGRFLSVRDTGWMKSQERDIAAWWNGGFNGVPLTNGFFRCPISIHYQNTPFEGYYYWMYAASQDNAAKCEFVPA